MSLKLKKMFRVFLWVMLVWIFARGVYSFFDKGQPVQAVSVNIPKPAVVEIDAAKTFATSFARDYFTFNATNLEERAKRLEGYLVKQLDRNAGLEIQANQTVNQTAVQAWPWSVKKVDNNQAVITVKVKVVAAARPETYFYLAVPVAAAGEGSYQVNDIPAVVPGPLVPELNRLELNGKDITGADEKAITDMANGFFKAYVQGQPAEITYYFLNPDSSVRGLASSMLFKELRDIRIVQTETGGVKAEVTAVLIEPLSKAIYKNHYILDLVNKDNRWYIKTIQP